MLQVIGIIFIQDYIPHYDTQFSEKYTSQRGPNGIYV